MALESCRICGGNENLKSILDEGPEIFDKLFKCANIVVSKSIHLFSVCINFK